MCLSQPVRNWANEVWRRIQYQVQSPLRAGRNPLKLTILGSGGSSVSAKRACPCFVVDESILIDLGSGSVKNLRMSNLNLNKISKVFISHFHADHISDLIPFLWTIQIDGRTAPLKIFGPPGFREIVNTLLRCTCTPDEFFKFPLSIVEIEFGQKIGTISTIETSHSVPTLGFRVESDGRVFCYSADTIYSSRIVELAKHADLLLHEATFTEDQSAIAELTRHSTARMAGRTAREAGAGKLALFHIPPPNEHKEQQFRRECADEYGGEVVISQDLTSIEF